MRLTTDQQDGQTVTSFGEVRTALQRFGPDSFAVLERPSGEFVQIAVSGQGFTLEKQDGGVDRHFFASLDGRTILSNTEVEDVFRAFFQGQPFPAAVTWQRMDVKGMPRIFGFMLRALPFVALLGLLALYARDLMNLMEW